MVAAGLLAKKAVEQGPDDQAVGQDLARARVEGGHRVSARGRAHALPRASSASTWSATAAPPASATRARCRRRSRDAIDDAQPGRGVGAVGQPQLRGPHQPRGARQLPDVAAAGRRLRARRPHRHRPRQGAARHRATSGKPVFLRDIWPSTNEVARDGRQGDRSRRCSSKSYARRVRGRRALARPGRCPSGETLRLGPGSRPTSSTRPTSTACPRPPAPVERHQAARACWPCSATASPPTTSRRPASSRRTAPPGKYLIAHGVDPKDFNSYGARRGNHEVMVRGTFANVRLKNLLAPGTEGGVTRHLPDGEGCRSSMPR